MIREVPAEIAELSEEDSIPEISLRLSSAVNAEEYERIYDWMGSGSLVAGEPFRVMSSVAASAHERRGVMTKAWVRAITRAISNHPT